MANTNILKKIQKEIGYNFNNSELLVQAFTRKTYSQENGGQDNEVLEFIGDKVLDMMVTKFLVNEHAFYDREKRVGQFIPGMDECAYTIMKKKLVEKTNLAKRMDKLGYHNFLILGKGDIKIDAKNDDSVKEDLFEAILGAVAIDCNWNFDVLYKVTIKLLKPAESGQPNSNKKVDIDDNYVSLLQEWHQKNTGELPKYETRQVGNDFEVVFKIEGYKNIFSAKDKSVKKAKMKVAQQAYEFLKKKELTPSLKNAVTYIQYDRVVNQLQELAQKKYISMPIYDFEGTPCLTGGTSWLCKCKVESEEIYVEKIGNSKPESRKNAAEEVLRIIQRKYNS